MSVTASSDVNEVTRSDLTIAWERIAEPQADGYDTDVVLLFAQRNGYRRAPVGNDPTIFDGMVAIRSDNTDLGTPAPPDHPNIKAACELVRIWQPAYQQCSRLLEAIAPFIIPGHSCDEDGGSSCGPGQRGFGTIATTINSVLGLAEAIVHETGHHKLRGLGVQVESAVRIIKNPPDQRFKSPIRYDSLRPMSAVLHAQYSYTYVSALDVAIVRTLQDETRDRKIAEFSLAVVIPKLEFGAQIIQEYGQLDAAGEGFLQGYFDWFHRLRDEAYQILETFGVKPVSFVHPLDGQKPTSCETTKLTPCAAVNVIGRPSHSPGVKQWRTSANTVTLRLTESGASLALNPSATAIWDLCDGTRTADEISDEIVLHCSVPADTIRTDVHVTVRQLETLGYLQLR